MKKFKIINFQDLEITNAEISKKPFDETKFEDEDVAYVVVIREPYAYFSYRLLKHIHKLMSPKLSKETIKNMKKMDTPAFLEWFKTLNYLPLINPQTFQLDLKKRVDVAIENLESFDYVVPYEKLDMFMEHVASESKIQPSLIDFTLTFNASEERALMEYFIGKDRQLYSAALELWQTSEAHSYKPIRSVNKKESLVKKAIASQYEGLVDNINTKMISGWVFNKKDHGNVTLGVYKNGILLQTTKAEILRQDILKLKKHPSGHCGFKITFEKPVFTKNDQIKVKVEKENIVLKYGKRVESFFQL